MINSHPYKWVAMYSSSLPPFRVFLVDSRFAFLKIVMFHFVRMTAKSQELKEVTWSGST